MNINWDLLVDKAMHGREFAYVPYSHFKVGSAVLLKDGTIIYGCNVENASYPNGTCSERNTLQKMISEGYTKADVLAFAIVGQAERPISPCGMCRQFMFEFAPDLEVICLNSRHEAKSYKLSDLLVHGFNGSSMSNR